MQDSQLLWHYHTEDKIKIIHACTEANGNIRAVAPWCVRRASNRENSTGSQRSLPGKHSPIFAKRVNASQTRKSNSHPPMSRGQ